MPAPRRARRRARPRARRGAAPRCRRDADGMAVLDERRGRRGGGRRNGRRRGGQRSQQAGGGDGRGRALTRVPPPRPGDRGKRERPSSPSRARRRGRRGTPRPRRSGGRGSGATAAGRRPPAPEGTAVAGTPARFAGVVKMSERYMASGSSTFSPSRKAADGAVGVTSRSALGEGGVELLPHPLQHAARPAVVGLVVAGREGEGAEHDPPLDLGAEPLARGSRSRGPARLSASGDRRP